MPSQALCARRTSSISSRAAPRPPPDAVTTSTRERTSCTASAGAADSPTRSQHGEIDDVVAHVGDVLVCQGQVGDDLLVGGELARDALIDQRDAQLRGAVRRGRRIARRQEADLEAGALRPDHRDAVPDGERLALRAVRVHHHDAVGEHAVDVEQQQLDPGGLGFEPSRQNISVAPEVVEVHDAGDACGSPSTTTIDVILRCSMMFSASTASVSDES